MINRFILLLPAAATIGLLMHMNHRTPASPSVHSAVPMPGTAHFITPPPDVFWDRSDYAASGSWSPLPLMRIHYERMHDVIEWNEHAYRPWQDANRLRLLFQADSIGGAGIRPCEPISEEPSMVAPLNHQRQVLAYQHACLRLRAEEREGKNGFETNTDEDDAAAYGLYTEPAKVPVVPPHGLTLRAALERDLAESAEMDPGILLNGPVVPVDHEQAARLMAELERAFCEQHEQAARLLADWERILREQYAPDTPMDTLTLTQP